MGVAPLAAAPAAEEGVEGAVVAGGASELVPPRAGDRPVLGLVALALVPPLLTQITSPGRAPATASFNAPALTCFVHATLAHPEIPPAPGTDALSPDP